MADNKQTSNNIPMGSEPLAGSVPANTKNMYSLSDPGPDPASVAKRLGLFAPFSDPSSKPDAK